MKPDRKHSIGRAPLACDERQFSPPPRFTERRRHERVSLIEPVKIQTSYTEMTGRMIEISNTGGSLEISCGFMPGLGTEMALTLRDNTHLWGRAARVYGKIVAIEFPVALTDIDSLLWVEQRGMDVYASRLRP